MRNFNITKFNYKWLIWRILMIFFVVYILIQLSENLDLINFDWYLRMKYPKLYRLLSSNISLIFSISIPVSLFIYSYIGFKLNIQMLTLACHIVLLLGLKAVYEVWHLFFSTIYIVIGILNIFYIFASKKSKKRIQHIKAIICLCIIIYYHLWNYFNNEPLTNFLQTPDFIPTWLCNYSSKSTNNFDKTFSDFIRIHNKMLEKSTPVNERRAVVFRAADGGLGNRLQGLLSSFLVAIVLKRAFFVDWQDHSKEAHAFLNDLFEVRA